MSFLVSCIKFACYNCYMTFSRSQVLAGDVDEAICHHAIYYSMWRKYGCLPERYNWQLEAPDVRSVIMVMVSLA